MTTVVLSPPSRPSSPPTAASTNSKATSNTILVTVAVEASVQKAGKEASASRIAESDSPTTTAITLEPAEALDVEGDDENIERRANSSSLETEESHGVAGVQKESAMPPEPRPIKKRRRVSFEAADIVEFEPTIYTTTVTSGGIPLGMSLNERSRSRRRLDSYEMERQTIRVGRQNYMEEGYLDPQEREIILNNAGCEEPVMATVEAEVNTIIQHRRESNEIDFDFMYGLGEIEGGDDDDDETPVLSFETTGLDGGEEEDEEEEDGEDGNSLEGDAPDDELPLVSMSEDESAGEEEPSASETVVNPSDCGETETAPV
ncbi:hypothetical protein BBJ28_00006777 [Nothophytophthora sp. Chile5]|nr:hypothetical protein BBJ28_00006777 [Nothophytophthora sp. Chile5]